MGCATSKTTSSKNNKNRGRQPQGNARRANNRKGNSTMVPPRDPAVPMFGSNVFGSNPTMMSGSEGSVRVVRKEKLLNLVTVGTDGITVIPNDGYLNPGLLSPWLRNFAHVYEKYRVNRIAFMYVPIVSYTSSGRIAMGVDYDAKDTDNTIDEIQGLQTQISFPAFPNPASPAYLEVPPALLRELFKDDKWLRSWLNVDSGGFDIHLYDFGRLHIAYAGCTATTSYGEIWMGYDVTFVMPHLSTDTTPGTVDRMISHPLATNQLFTATSDTWVSSGTANSKTGWNLVSASTLVCNTTGEFLFTGYATGCTVPVAGAVNWAAGPGITATALFTHPDTGGTSFVFFGLVTVLTPGSYIAPSAVACCTNAPAHVDWRICRYVTAYGDSFRRLALEEMYGTKRVVQETKEQDEYLVVRRKC